MAHTFSSSATFVTPLKQYDQQHRHNQEKHIGIGGPIQGQSSDRAGDYNYNYNYDNVLPAKLTMNEPAAAYSHQMLGMFTNEIVNVSTEWLNSSSTTTTESPYILDGDAGLDESGYVPYTERLETYIVPCLFAIIFIIGVLGNGVLILIFLRHRTMRNVPNMYICSLAVGDILVILFCVPFTSTVYTVESWPYGLLVCKFSEFIKDVSIGVSVFTLTALSADRYFAIVDPMRKLHGCRATRVTCITITGIWILSILIALPSVLFSYIRVIDEDPSHTFLVCYPFPPELGPTYPKIIVMFKFLVYYAIPLVFIATFYIIMAHHLVLSTKDMPGEIHGQTKQIQARKKVAKMVLSFVVIFAICFFPSHVFLLWFYYNPNSEENFNAFWNFLRIVGFCLGFINSCINPITLYCLSGTFRKHFNKNLFCCISSTQDRRPPHNRNLLACGACVSMSNSAHMNGGGTHPSASTDPHRRTLRGGYGGGGGGTYRTTATMTGTQKRCATWDSSQNQFNHPALLVHNPRQIMSNVITATAAAAEPNTMMMTRLHNGNGHAHALSVQEKTQTQRFHDERPQDRDNIEICSSPLRKPEKLNKTTRGSTLTSSSDHDVRQLSLEDLTMMTSFINNSNGGIKNDKVTPKKTSVESTLGNSTLQCV